MSDEKKEEQVKAMVCPQRGPDLTLQEIFDMVDEKIAREEKEREEKEER